MSAVLWAVLVALFFAPTDAWKPVTTPMQDGRWAPTGVVLSCNGQEEALIVGGYSYRTRRCVPSADLFDPRTQRFSPSQGRLTYPRDFACTALLPDGKALIVGGYNTVWGSLATAEVYDPAHDAFQVLPDTMSSPRELFQMTPLTDGRLLITGGFDTGSGHTLGSAEIFDPQAQTFRRTGSLNEDRFGHASVRLADGRVLIVGGKHWVVGQPDRVLASAEIYDPATHRFHRTRGALHTPRDRPTATLLPDGTVLIAGGQNGAEGPRAAEIFDPQTEQITVLDSHLTTARMAHADLPLSDGRVLLAGGWDQDAHATTATTELYDPKNRTFVPGPLLPFDGHDLALLQFSAGLVLTAGGKKATDGHAQSLDGGAFWLPAPDGLKSP